MASTNGTGTEPSYFEQQRRLLVNQIGLSLEQVLQNLNKLNRGLESITEVGNEFSSVEALWSHFENVMAQEPGPEQTHDQDAQDAAQGKTASS